MLVFSNETGEGPLETANPKRSHPTMYSGDEPLTHPALAEAAAGRDPGPDPWHGRNGRK
jgi:hypothetical protein